MITRMALEALVELDRKYSYNQLNSNFMNYSFIYSSFKKVIDTIIVDDLKVETMTKKITVQGCLKDVAPAAASKSKKKKDSKSILEVHNIRAEFHEVLGELTVVQCMDCDKTKGNFYLYLKTTQETASRISGLSPDIQLK